MLIAVLMRDPSSWLQASYSGWEFPVSREWIVAAHSYDLLAMVNSGKGKKPKPYPNPFPTKSDVRVGKTDLPRGVVVAHLAKMNPKES